MENENLEPQNIESEVDKVSDSVSESISEPVSEPVSEEMPESTVPSVSEPSEASSETSSESNPVTETPQETGKKKEKKSKVKEKKVKAVKEKPERTPKSVVSRVLIAVSVILLLASAMVFSISFFVVPSTAKADWMNIGSNKLTEIGAPDSFSQIDNSTDSTANDWVYGKPNGTDYIADDGAYYYLPNICDSNYIYKVSKSEPRTSEKLADIPCSRVNVVDGKLYFLNRSDDSEYEKGIYCINTDGTGLECMSRGKYSDLLVVNNWLYFIDNSNDKLTKMNTSARKHIIVSDKTCTRFSIAENNIYYISKTDSDGYDMYSLEKMNVNGKSNMVISDYINGPVNFFVSDRIAYCIAESSSVYTINAGNGSVNYLLFSTFMSSIAKKDNKLYFIDKEQDYALCVCDLDTQLVSTTNITQVSGFDLADNLLIIYYRNNGTSPKVSVNDLSTGKAVPFFN